MPICESSNRPSHQAQRLLEDNQNKVDQGTLAPIEATRAEAQVASARQDLINSEGYVRQQELILKTVLARNWSENPLVHDARVIRRMYLGLNHYPPSPTLKSWTSALANRPELQAAKLQNNQLGDQPERHKEQSAARD